MQKLEVSENGLMARNKEIEELKLNYEKDLKIINTTKDEEIEKHELLIQEKLNTIEKLEEELNLFKCENNSKNCEIEKLNSETLKLSNQIKEREMIYSDTSFNSSISLFLAINPFSLTSNFCIISVNLSSFSFITSWRETTLSSALDDKDKIVASFSLHNLSNCSILFSSCAFLFVKSKNCEIEKLNSETLKLSNQIKEREMIYSDTIDKHEKQLLDKENVTKQYEIKVQELEHNIMEKKTEIENLRKVFSTQEESMEKVHSEKMKLVEELLEKDLTLGKLEDKLQTSEQNIVLFHIHFML
jgi:hypothetical protein